MDYRARRPMGAGAIDPGVLLTMDSAAWRPCDQAVHSQSGLLGMSGISSDMRTLLASDDPSAKRAIDVYVYRIGRELGSLAAALGGLDALVFTAGIGERSAVIRERVCRDAEWLGVKLDPVANSKDGPRISAEGSRVSAWVIPTNEELMIARHTQRLIAGAQRETT
jgi:acetate kinase